MKHPFQQSIQQSIPKQIDKMIVRLEAWAECGWLPKGRVERMVTDLFALKINLQVGGREYE